MTKPVVEMTYVELEAAIRELKAKTKEEGYTIDRGDKLAEMYESKRTRDKFGNHVSEVVATGDKLKKESRSMNAAQCIEFLREEVECALSNDWPMTASNLRECANCIESLLLIANEPRKQEVALQREDER